VTGSRLRTLVGFAVVAVILGFFPAIQEGLELPRFLVIFLFTIMFWVAQASSWNILTGFAGYFSFGQGAWYGIGVYTVSVLVGKHGWPFVAALPLAGLAAGVAGLLLGVVVFRLRRLSGEIFALTTLAVAFVLAAVARLLPAIDGGTGVFMTGTALPEFLGDSTTATYRLTLVFALLTVLTAYLIHDSRLGWGLFAIRDDEEVADGLGVPVFRYKMAALGANAFLAGLMGGLWSLRLGFVTVDDVFNIRVPLFVILMSVLGGMSHWMGPVVGAVIITTLSDRLNSAELADVSQIIIGALLVVLALAVREGVYLRMRDRWVTTAAIFFGVLTLVTLLDINSSFISDFAYAMVATTVAMLVPSGVWERMRASRGGTTGDGPPETPTEDLTEANT